MTDEQLDRGILHSVRRIILCDILGEHDWAIIRQERIEQGSTSDGDQVIRIESLVNTEWECQRCGRIEQPFDEIVVGDSSSWGFSDVE